jgi:predicted phosphodiesterase
VKLGLIGDVHAEDDLLRVTLDAFRKLGVDRVLCTGDLVDGIGNVDRVCQLLVEANALVVRGNHDRWIRTDEMRSLPRAHKMTDLAVETVTLLKGLPSTVTLDIPGGQLLLCHGVGANDMCRLGPDDHGYAISSNQDLLTILFDVRIRIMVGGHTHRPMLRRFNRGPASRPPRADSPPPSHLPLVVVNPGTLARDDEPGFALLDLYNSRVDFHRIDPDHRIRHVSSTAL